MKIADIPSEQQDKFHWIFQENVTFDNIKSHRKSEFHPLCGRYITGKTTEESNWSPLSLSKFKEHVEIVKTCKVKLNVTILNWRKMIKFS